VGQKSTSQSARKIRWGKLPHPASERIPGNSNTEVQVRSVVAPALCAPDVTRRRQRSGVEDTGMSLTTGATALPSAGVGKAYRVSDTQASHVVSQPWPRRRLQAATAAASPLPESAVGPARVLPVR